MSFTAVLWAVMMGSGAAHAQDGGGFGAARLLSGTPEFSADCF